MNVRYSAKQLTDNTDIMRKNTEMLDVTWNDVAENIAAGNLDKVVIGNDFDSLSIEVIYVSFSQDGVTAKQSICLSCHNCCYIDMRRRHDHEPGSGIILDAYLRTESDLIAALYNHQLDAISGCLFLEAGGNNIYHLEIIGEVNLNVLCGNVTIKATPIQ